MKSARFDTGTFDSTRFSMLGYPLDQINRVNEKRSGASAEVTHRRLTLGAIDSTTGWYAKTWENRTIDMTILPRGQTGIVTPTGAYAKYAVTAFTEEPIQEDDEIKDDEGHYYEVKTVEGVWMLNEFLYYTCELMTLPLHADRPSTSGTWATVDDPKHRTKAWLDTYLNSDNITLDDGAERCQLITAYGTPDYSMTRVFLGKGVDVVYSLSDSSSTASIDWDGTAIGYQEQIPIAVFCIDKEDVTALNLKWKAEAELRRIMEENPLGSYRSLERRGDTNISLGSSTIYGFNFVLTYNRDTT